jgi:hypothetical protein
LIVSAAESYTIGKRRTCSSGRVRKLKEAKNRKRKLAQESTVRGAFEECQGEPTIRAQLMAFGFNSDVAVNDVTYHVQTEPARGGRTIVTNVFVAGSVVSSRRSELAAGVSDDEIARRLREQHSAVIADLRSGNLK